MPTIGPLHHHKPGTEAGRLACSEQRSICLSVSTTHASFAGEVQWMSLLLCEGLCISRFECYPLMIDEIEIDLEDAVTSPFDC